MTLIELHALLCHTTNHLGEAFDAMVRDDSPHAAPVYNALVELEQMAVGLIPHMQRELEGQGR